MRPFLVRCLAAVAASFSTLPLVLADPPPPKLPPPPPGVTHLAFGEFFGPVGARGLVLSPKLRALDGKRVRLLGYMVRQETPQPGVLLLAPRPLRLHEPEYGLADDLPAALAYVFLSPSSAKPVPFTPGPLLLTGVLSVGNRPEPDGRISLVRLRLDPPTQRPPQPARTPSKKG